MISTVLIILLLCICCCLSSSASGGYYIVNYDPFSGEWQVVDKTDIMVITKKSTANWIMYNKNTFDDSPYPLYTPYISASTKKTISSQNIFTGITSFIECTDDNNLRIWTTSTDKNGNTKKESGELILKRIVMTESE